jgi:hypothetical protein
MTFYEVSIYFWTIGSTFQAFYGTFRYLSYQTITCSYGSQNDTFRHSNGPSPRTDHSLRHSTTRVGLRARRVRILFFRENVRFGRFLWAIAHGFRHLGQFFGNLPDCHKILVDDILWGFDWFLDHRAHVPGLLRVVWLPFLANNYVLKWKPEWHISSLERSLLHVLTIV